MLADIQLDTASWPDRPREMMATVPEEPKQPTGPTGPTGPEQARPPKPPAPDPRPVLPERSTDETDAGWGERPEPDDDERLRQERPPHYDQ
jgi:hypothetical protein